MNIKASSSMSIGDKPIGGQRAWQDSAHPQLGGEWVDKPGITYREWLIGKALSGFATKSERFEPEHFADACIRTADAIIKRLDDEQRD